MSKDPEFYSPKATGLNNGLDTRTHAIRPDLADQDLEGQVQAERFVTPNAAHVVQSCCALRTEPSPRATQVSELLLNESAKVFETGPEYSWVQCNHDGYMGYVENTALKAGAKAATTRYLSTNLSHLYAEPDMKTPPVMEVYGGTAFPVHDDASRKRGFVEVDNGLWLYEAHLTPDNRSILDIARSYLGAPYLWGGRTICGIDCSGLVQISLMRAGLSCPRDSDMQTAELGEEINGDLQAGDLVFFPGHVGFMADETHLLHANAHHMAVTIDPLEEVVERIRRNQPKPVTARKRLM